MSFGFVYVMSNMAMQDVLKVGFTTIAPSERARQLSSATGVPEPFSVEYYAEVANPKLTERLAHDRLAKFRWNESREFFRVGLLHAIHAIEEFDGNPDHYPVYTSWYGNHARLALSWMEKRGAAIERCGNRCDCCGASNVPLAVHHMSKENDGWWWMPSNHRPLCKDCSTPGELCHFERAVMIMRGTGIVPEYEQA